MFARTERLLLRPSWPEDAPALHAAMSDEDIVRNLALAPWPYSKQDADDFAGTQQSVTHPHFFLFQRTGGAPRLIGCCGLGNSTGETEIGYWIARPYWGLGYASEAAKAVIDIARAIGHKHLVAGHFTDNPASGAVLRKIGFNPTGRIAMRHSKGRGGEAPCALYERDLGSDGETELYRKEDGEVMILYDATPIAA